MAITTTIVLDHRNRARENQEAMLEIRVTQQRRTQYIATGIKVRKSEWIAGHVVNRLDAKSLNDRLVIIYNKVGEALNEAIGEGRPVEIADIRERVFNVVEISTSRNSFLDWVAEQIPLLSIEESTRKHYDTLYRRLEEFGQLRHWKDLTPERICEFDAWLRSLRKDVSDSAARAGIKGEKLTEASIYNYHKKLKALLYRADRFGKIPRNPYAKLKGQFKRGDKETLDFLTEQEMQDILRLQLPVGSTLDVARDLFVFQMFTGLSYSDAESFDFSQYRLVDGTWRNIGQRIKTGVPYVCDLLPPAVEVLQKYGGTVPRINNADYNHRLKDIGLLAGITTRMHSHLARHTFATWILSNDAKIENLRRMLGHKSITTTLRYAKVLAQSVHEDFDNVKDKIPGFQSGQTEKSGQTETPMSSENPPQ